MKRATVVLNLATLGHLLFPSAEVEIVDVAKESSFWSLDVPSLDNLVRLTLIGDGLPEECHYKPVHEVHPTWTTNAQTTFRLEED